MSKKTQRKKQDKVIQDKTFGLKNKNKSKTVQKFIKGVQSTVKHAGVAMGKLEAEQFERKKQKILAEQQKALLGSLFYDVNKNGNEEQEEEDPANMVCPYFKQGLCQKGKKCIYSHDLTLDRTEDIDLYVDQRTQLIMNALGGKQLHQLSEQELSKHIGEKEREIVKGCRSDVVCKFFLEACQKSKYGWNWSCPNNGDRCKYKHCLPPGYRLKKDQGKAEEAYEVDIEAKIDEERGILQAMNKQSPLVTFEIFMKWKEDRKKRKDADNKKKKDDDEKKTKNKGQLRTGRQLFTYDPSLFVDDDEAAAEYEAEVIPEEEEDEEKKENIYGDDEEDEEEEEKQEKIEEDPEAENDEA